MRMYEFTITDPSGMVWYPSQTGLGFVKQNASWGASFSSLYTPWQLNTASSQLIGQTNPSALNVEFDMVVAPWHTLQGGDGASGSALVSVWGLGVQALAQAANLNPVKDSSGAWQFKSWTLRAGMAAGLPLANPSQAGILATGIISQAYGNWQDTNQTLDLILWNGVVLQDNAPLSFNWQKGQNLSDALTQTFAAAFPNFDVELNISANLVAPTTQPAMHTSYGAFAKWLRTYTQKIGAQSYGSSYPGVSLTTQGNEINAFDGTVSQQTVALAFQDLIGQPTWISPARITFATVLRGDIVMNDRVTFPAGTMSPYVLTQPGAATPGAPASSSMTFGGTFQIVEVHHYANFREPDASSWATVYVANSLISTQ